MYSDNTFDECVPQHKMRKRKRGAEYGSYVDEDTGEVTTVQTSKQAKRAHQKSGKWYKEPTEAELRAWDREEKRQALADRAAKREENKKLNAAKRAEKERKDELLKRQMFQTGKITFTQTLAKKDEDQKNLHSWFGVRPGISKLKKSAAVDACAASEENKENEDKDSQFGAIDAVHNHGIAADGEACLNKIKKLSQHDTDHLEEEIDYSINIEDTFEEVITSENRNQAAGSNKPIDTETMDQFADLIMDQDMIPDFEILEDDSAGDVVPDQDTDLPTINPFKVPALPALAQSSPKRLPLSPMSPSDVNVRNSQTTTQVSSFKARLENAKIDTTPSTQAVRDILWGISTQDLNDDLEDVGKENDEPEIETATSIVGSPIKSVKNSSPLKNVSCASKTGSAPTDLNKSFNSNIDPTDYDSIFFELDAAEWAGCSNDPDHDYDDDDFDDGLDDATLLSLPPATQLMSAARKCKVSKDTSVAASNPVKPPRQPLTRADSFALAFEDLNDDDLLAGLDDFERTQHKENPSSASVSTATAVPARASRSMAPSTVASRLKKKGRVLPWERPSEDADTDVNVASLTFEDIETANDDGEDIDGDGDIDMGTQDTELLSSFGY